METQSLPPAGFFRRLGALFYDSLIILAVVMMAGGVVVAVMEALVAAGLISYAPYADASDLLGNHPFWSLCTPLISRLFGSTLSYSFGPEQVRRLA